MCGLKGSNLALVLEEQHWSGVYLSCIDCLEDEYQCNSGECIPESFTCDGITFDCDENEDESDSLCGAISKFF